MEDTETVEMTFKELIDYIIKNNLKVEQNKNEILKIHLDKQGN